MAELDFDDDGFVEMSRFDAVDPDLVPTLASLTPLDTISQLALDVWEGIYDLVFDPDTEPDDDLVAQDDGPFDEGDESDVFEVDGDGSGSTAGEFVDVEEVDSDDGDPGGDALDDVDDGDAGSTAGEFVEVEELDGSETPEAIEIGDDFDLDDLDLDVDQIDLELDDSEGVIDLEHGDGSAFEDFDDPSTDLI